MVPIISIVGVSNSGKTTLIEKLIPELMKRGYRVATVKHDVHDFEMDKEGKDSWRHKNAGARTAIISSPGKIAVISDTDKDLTLDEIRTAFIHSADIILSEGYKRESWPKIEVSRKALNRELICSPDDESVLAVASDYPASTKAAIVDINDITKIADLIEEKLPNNARKQK